MTKIAIDIGYGHTKVKTDEKEFKFPTAVKVLKTQMIENNDYYLFEGKKYSVGEDALRGAISTRDYSFIYRYAPIIIHHALEMLEIDPKEKVQISTGLSLYDMEKAAEFDNASANRKEEFKKRLSKFTINDVVYEYDIRLFAQGQGSWFNFSQEHGFIDNGSEIIVDIGYRTNDILVYTNGKASKAESIADDKGVNVIVSELKTVINKKYDIELSEQEVNEILKTKKITIYGVDKPLDDVIQDIVESYIDDIYSKLKANLGNVLKSARRVLFTGGGSAIIKEFLDTYPQNVLFDDSIEFGNVRGYYNG